MAQNTYIPINEQLERNRRRAAEIKRLQNPGPLEIKPLSSVEEYEFLKAAYKDDPNVTVAQSSRGPVVLRRSPLSTVEPVDLNATQFGLPRQKLGFDSAPKPLDASQIIPAYSPPQDPRALARPMNVPQEFRAQQATPDPKAQARLIQIPPEFRAPPKTPDPLGQARVIEIPQEFRQNTPAPTPAPLAQAPAPAVAVPPAPAPAAMMNNPANNVRVDLPAINANGKPASLNAPLNPADHNVKLNIPVMRQEGSIPPPPRLDDKVRLNIPAFKPEAPPTPTPVVSTPLNAPAPQMGNQVRFMKVPTDVDLKQAVAPKPGIGGAVSKVGRLGTMGQAGVQAAQGDYAGAAKTAVTDSVTDRVTQKTVEAGTRAAVKGLEAAATAVEKKGLTYAANLLKTGGTKLPFGIGLAIAGGFAAYEYNKARDLEKQAQAKDLSDEQRKQFLDEAASKKRSAGLTLAGGAAAIVPVVGTAASVSINAVNVALDVKDGLKSADATLKNENLSRNAQRASRGTHGMNPTQPATVAATKAPRHAPGNQLAA